MSKAAPKSVSKAAATKGNALSAEELRLINAWWRACNYLSVGMIYLRGNPLTEPHTADRQRA
jgi:phosphoketolase